jgi:hypothetical protein
LRQGLNVETTCDLKVAAKARACTDTLASHQTPGKVTVRRNGQYEQKQ